MNDINLSWRGFRYQTGEVKLIAEKMKEAGLAEADIDKEEELEVLIADLKKEGVFKVEGLDDDYNARDTVEEPEFKVRIGFYTKLVKVSQISKDEILYLDIFHIEEPEKGYDEVFWG